MPVGDEFMGRGDAWFDVSSPHPQDTQDLSTEDGVGAAGRQSWKLSGQNEHSCALHPGKEFQDTSEDSHCMPGAPPQPTPCLKILSSFCIPDPGIGLSFLEHSRHPLGTTAKYNCIISVLPPRSYMLYICI